MWEAEQRVQATALVSRQQSRWFRVYDGFWQGCHLSPLLYITLVEELDKEKLGVKVSEVWCGPLLYADDVLMVEAGKEDIGYCRKSKKKWRVCDEEIKEEESLIPGYMLWLAEEGEMYKL